MGIQTQNNTAPTTIRAKKYSGGDFPGSSDKRKVLEFGSKQDTEQLCNSIKEKIGLGCEGVEGFSSLKAENRLKMPMECSTEYA